ncbi:MAG TPA: dihydrolipoyl dehydrogenase [Candidatus Norongarragalinales archaeon]|nr:dihydrolipoyl dehydrogenase [Candidatus Norongarragalinales archaeon]
MKKFDLIVIGAGSGLDVAAQAALHGWKIAVVEKGPMGGTCLNRGCIPSKILLHSADVAEIIGNSGKFGVRKEGKLNVDFRSIISRASRIVDEDARGIEKAIRMNPNYTLYKSEGKFIGRKIIKVGTEEITSGRIVISAGTRPAVPKIEGLENSGYLTSDEALRLESQPRSMIIIGGGYIAAEMAHFFGALGTEITIVESADRLLASADAEISRRFTAEAARKYNVLTGFSAQRVQRKGKMVKLIALNLKTGRRKSISAESILTAAGRVPNSDLLDASRCGLALNERGYIRTNEFLETNVYGIWAFGDIAGKYLFKHSANLEANYINQYLFSGGHKHPVDYHAMPWAVFSSPQVAGVGKTEEQLKAEGAKYAVGRYEYGRTAMGLALQEEGLVKALVERKTGKILGCFIIGPEASILIHEVVVAMKSGDGSLAAIRDAVHAHPALSEVVQRAFNAIEI